MANKKQPTVYDLLEEACKMRELIYNKSVLLRKVALKHDYEAVKRIADEIKELCK